MIKDKEKQKIKYGYTQDFIPVKNIRNGMIETTDGRFLKILEIEPINFLLRTPKERNEIIGNFFTWLKKAPVKLHFKVTNMYVDSSELIANIINNTANEKSKLLLKRRDAYIQFIRDLSSKEALTKRFFIIYQYEGVGWKKEKDVAEISKEMEKIKIIAKNDFSNMGNSIIEHENENVFMAEVIYKYFNKRTSKERTLANRINRIISDNYVVASKKQEEFDKNLIPEINYIAPMEINDTESPDYLVADGLYYTFLYVKSEGYPYGKVTSGWIEKLTNFGEYVDLDMYAIKRDRRTTMRQLKSNINLRISESNDSDRGYTSMDDVVSARDSAIFTRRQMKNNNEDLYDVFTILTLSSPSLVGLNELKNNISRELNSTDYVVGECASHCKEAFLMAAPLMEIDEKLFKKGRRNFLTSSLASTYMFTAFELFDPTGFLFGINASNGSLVAINPFNSDKYKNANMIILGTPGAGKTFFEQLAGHHMRETGIQVFYILPNKGYEYRKACNDIDGTFIKLAPMSTDCINIMEIRAIERLDEEFIQSLEEDFEDKNLLENKIQQIITFIQLLMRDEKMNNTEETLLNTLLMHLYNDFGITEDNESIWKEKEKKILKTMPIIGDMYQRVAEDERLERIKVILDPFINGTCQNMNGQTNVDLSNKYICFDTSSAGKTLMPAFTFLALDCVYDIAKADRTQNKAIFMDEVWKIMINQYGAEFVLEVVKIIRGYGGSAILATQELNDYLKYSYKEIGESIINCSKIRIILNMESQEAARAQKILHLSDAERKSVEKYNRGEGLLIANGDKTPILIRATKEEIKMFTTDAKTLRRFREEDRRKQYLNLRKTKTGTKTEETK